MKKEISPYIFIESRRAIHTLWISLFKVAFTAERNADDSLPVKLAITRASETAWHMMKKIQEEGELLYDLGEQELRKITGDLHCDHAWLNHDIEEELEQPTA